MKKLLRPGGRIPQPPTIQQSMVVNPVAVHADSRWEVQGRCRRRSGRLVEETEAHVVVRLLLLYCVRQLVALFVLRLGLETNPLPWPPPWLPRRRRRHHHHHHPPQEQQHHRRSRRWRGGPLRPCPRAPTITSVPVAFHISLASSVPWRRAGPRWARHPQPWQL